MTKKGNVNLIQSLIASVNSNSIIKPLTGQTSMKIKVSLAKSSNLNYKTNTDVCRILTNRLLTDRQSSMLNLNLHNLQDKTNKIWKPLNTWLLLNEQIYLSKSRWKERSSQLTNHCKS